MTDDTLREAERLYAEAFGAYRKWDQAGVEHSVAHVAFDAGYRAVHAAHEACYTEAPRDASIGLETSPHKHDWINHSQENGATFATCSFCLTCVQLR